MTWLVLALAAVASLTAALVLRRRFVVVQVEGVSMEPALRHAQWVLVRRVGLPRVRRGQVVVLALPESEPGFNERLGNPQWMIKRVLALPGDPVPRAQVPALHRASESTIPAGKLVVLGDNPAASYDSRRNGYFDADTLVGVVVRTMQSVPSRTATRRRNPG